MNHSPQTSRGKYPRAGLTIESRTKKLFIKRAIMHKTHRRQQTIQLKPSWFSDQSLYNEIQTQLNQLIKYSEDAVPNYFCDRLARYNKCPTVVTDASQVEDDKSIRHKTWFLVACSFPKTTSEHTTTTTPIYLVVRPKAHSTTSRSSIRDHPSTTSGSAWSYSTTTRR